MIFYFSATGNNQRIAELLAKGANEDMVPIASALKNGRFRYSLNNRENLGFVIPVYFYTTPQPVIDFVEQLEISGAADCYTYIVVSYGTHTGKAGIRLASLLKKKGISADALYSVRTVDTFLPEFDIPEGAALERVLDSADRQTAVIKAEIARRARGDWDRGEGFFPKLVHPISRLAYERARNTAHLSVETSHCIGCGLCSRVCPVEAIEMKDGHPVWAAKRCGMCLGCLHRCPKSAISYDGAKTAGKIRYTNPRTKLKLPKAAGASAK